MAGEVANIEVFSPLKLRSGLIRNYHAPDSYREYNLNTMNINKHIGI